MVVEVPCAHWSSVFVFYFFWRSFSLFFFGQVCGNLGKYSSLPKNFACSHTYGPRLTPFQPNRTSAPGCTEKTVRIVLVLMHFIQWKQFSETNVTLHAFQKLQVWRFFLNASMGLWKRCGGPHAAPGPVVGSHWSKIMNLSLFLTAWCGSY